MAGNRPDADFQDAIRHHQAGDLARAAVLYRKVLSRVPGHADALHLSGVIAAQSGKHAAALDLLGRAVRIRPDHADSWNDYGNALLGAARPMDALAAYDRALALQPESAGTVLNRGNALRDVGRTQEALESYDRALALEPGNAGALCNRGNALRELGRPLEAIDCYDEALRLGAINADALANRAAARKDLGQLEEAARDCEEALALHPDHVTALNNLGDILGAIGRHADAASAFDRLLLVSPGYDYAPGYALHARLRACDWNGHAETVASVVAGVRARRRTVEPFAFLAMSDSSADQARSAQVHVAHKFPGQAARWDGPRYGHGRIRIAYLSADFHEHATARLAAGLFEAHDRERFEVTAISYGPQRRDAMRERLERAFDRFVDASAMTDAAAADLLRELEIDIAVDLKGYTQDARPGILATRAAPVQATYLGFPGTLAAPFVDYAIVDPHVVTQGDAAQYLEALAILPHSYQVNDARRPIAATTSSRAGAGLPETGFVFCCFNASYKITPRVFDVWMRLLRDVEGSALWLFEDNADAVANLRREAARRGVNGERLVFAPRLSPAAHLARHRLADLFLDTQPYNAHTTASDALWAGLPVLTCEGRSFAGRVGGSLLRAAGLPELIMPDLAAYEAEAGRLARDPARLEQLRAKLASNRGAAPLFDTARFARHLEAAYVTMRDRAERGELPATFSVRAQQ